jgi:hypothetical protein
MTQTQQPSLKTSLKLGDIVGVANSAQWIREGSDPLPDEWWLTVPKDWQFTPTVPICYFPDSLKQEFQEDHTIVFLINGKCRVRNLRTRRSSIFLASDVYLREARP